MTSKVTLDLRVTVDDDRQEVLSDIQEVVGPEFKLTPLYAPEESDASVRRLSSKSPSFRPPSRLAARSTGPSGRSCSATRHPPMILASCRR